MNGRTFPLPLLLLALFCAHGGGTAPAASSPAGHGAIEVTFAPNPIVAQPVGGNTYEFPFDIVVRETGGHPLTINKVTLTVYAFGMPVNVDKYEGPQIDALGFERRIGANGQLHYHLQPRRTVTDDRLFSNITAGVRIDATDDDTRTAVSNSTQVSITR